MKLILTTVGILFYTLSIAQTQQEPAKGTSPSKRSIKDKGISVKQEKPKAILMPVPQTSTLTATEKKPESKLEKKPE